MMDEFWFEINKPPFSEENACITRQQPMVHHPKYPRFSLTKRCILKIIHYLTLTLDKATRNIGKLRHVTNEPAKPPIATCNG